MLIRFAACAALEIVQSSSGKYQMRVRINKSRQNNATTNIDNLCFASALFDFVAWADDLDPAIADQHSAIPNNREIGHFLTGAWSLCAGECEQLRCVKNG